MANSSSSARFGPVGIGDPRITFRLDTKQFVHLTDKISRKFLGGDFQRALVQANQEAAVAVQISIAQALEETIRATHAKRDRPRRAGERLRSSIMNQDNYEATASSFRVGIPAWYERSPAAAYWRVIERGTGPYDTEGFFMGPGVVGPQPRPAAQMRMPQMLGQSFVDPDTGRVRRPAKIHVAGIKARKYHRKGALRALERLDMGERYRKHLRPIGLEMQVRD